MRPLAKAGLVGAGYIGALALASVVVAVHLAVTSGPDRQGSSGMSAFGDGLLFLAVFGVAATVPSAAVLFFLRPYRPFWGVLSVASLLVATTAGAAFVVYLTAQSSDPQSVAGAWSAMAILRILIAPLFALAFLVSTVMAPSRGSRLALLTATAFEALAVVGAALILFHPFQSR